jgi:hypothetical protein
MAATSFVLTSPVHSGIAKAVERYDLNAYAARVKVYAVKP